MNHRTWDELERTFLGKSVSRKGESLGAFYGFYTNRGYVWGLSFRQTQDSYLAENLVVDLGDQVILAAGVLPPNLPELDGLDCHGVPPVIVKTN
jgi:hypothetical protein